MGDQTKVRKALAELNDNEMVQTDQQFNTQSPKDKHESAYTTILDAYAENIRETLQKKRLFKSMIFWLSFLLLSGVSLLFVILLIVLVAIRAFAELKEWSVSYTHLRAHET